MSIHFLRSVPAVTIEILRQYTVKIVGIPNLFLPDLFAFDWRGA
jgi:hypothetical protein